MTWSLLKQCFVDYANTGDRIRTYSTQHYFLAYGLTIVACIGIFATLCNCMVICSTSIWHKLRKFMLVLAFWDFCTLIFLWILVSLPELIINSDAYTSAFRPMMTYWYSVLAVCLCGRIYSTILLSSERYLALCRPLQHRRFYGLQYRNSCVYGVMLLIALFATLMNLPRLKEYEMVDCTEVMMVASKMTNYTRLFGRRPPLLRSAESSLLYKVLVGTLLSDIIPLIIQFALTLKIVITLKQQTHLMERQYSTVRRGHNLEVPRPEENGTDPPNRRSNLNQCHGRIEGRGVNRGLLIGLFVASLCYICPAIINLLHLLPAKQYDSLLSNSYFKFLVVTVHFILMINSSCAFFINLCVSHRFREQFVNILRCRWTLTTRQHLSEWDSTLIRQATATMKHFNSDRGEVESTFASVNVNAVITLPRDHIITVETEDVM